MTDIDPDVELIARAIAAADNYVDDGWKLCVPVAEAVREVLGERLVPVGEWEYGAIHGECPHFGPWSSRERVEQWVNRHMPTGEPWRAIRRRAAALVPAGDWEEVGLDSDVRADIASSEVT